MTGISKKEKAKYNMSNLLGFLVFLMIGVSNGYAADWEREVVDPTGIGTSSSMKIDRNGNVHLAYVIDGANHNLKYGFWDHTIKRWFIMQVDQNSGPCSLTLDSKQNPHIAYVDFGTASGSKLRHASWDGKTWTRQMIPLSSDVIAYFNSIVLDEHDYPSISFYEYRGPRGTDLLDRMRTVTWNGNTWEVRTVDSDNQSGKFNSMAADSKGNIHLAYANVAAMTAGLRYAEWDGKAWKAEIVDSLARNNGGTVGYSTALALDSRDQPHITYMNISTGQVLYAARTDGEWKIEIVDNILSAAYPDRNSIVISESGVPYVGYFDSGRGILKVAHKRGDKWIAEVVDSGGVGFNSSIQIADGMLWISYADGAQGALKVARRTIQSELPVSAKADQTTVTAETK